MNTGKSRQLPQGGDPLIDWIFNALILLLKHVKIYKVRGLKDPGDNTVLDGYMVDLGDSWEIYLDARSNDPLELILIHELAHALFCDVISDDEDLISNLETVLWDKFTENQKSFLKSFMPKRVSKKKPKKLSYDFKFTFSDDK